MRWYVKRKELQKRLVQLGWRFFRRGAKHDIWTNGQQEVAVPRHKEINEYTAKAVLNRAAGGN